MTRLKDGIIITSLDIEDLHQVYSLGSNEPLFKDSINPWTPDNISSILASDSFTAFTARRKKKILGFIIGSTEKNETEILWFMVVPHLRKKGIGGALLDSFMKSRKSEGINKIFIRLLKNNLDTINFLCKKGLIENENITEMVYKIPE